MNQLEALLVGPLDELPSSTLLQRKPLTVSRNDDVSMMIETVSGKLINITDPRAEDITLQDIAWALSRIPRFAGHTITETVYNVAQHSVYVAQLAEELMKSREDFALDEHVWDSVLNISQIGNVNEFLLKTLVHDAHEAYTGDIPSPVKRIPELRETFRLIESKLDHAIFMHFGFDELSEDERTVIKYCDKLAQAIEGYQFMPSRGFNWVLPKPTLKRLQRFPAPKPPLQSYDDFISHFEYLSRQ